MRSMFYNHQPTFPAQARAASSPPASTTWWRSKQEESMSGERRSGGLRPASLAKERLRIRNEAAFCDVFSI